MEKKIIEIENAGITHYLEMPLFTVADLDDLFAYLNDSDRSDEYFTF